jgi:hypothetical protein
MKPFALIALLGFAAALPAKAETSPQKPGKWRHTMQIEMTGMPVKMPPVTFEHCVTAEDLKDPQKAIPTDPKSQCNITDYKISGNTVTWSMDCPQQKMKGDGKLTYTDDSYTGTMQMTIGEQEMLTKYSGKFLGACD